MGVTTAFDVEKTKSSESESVSKQVSESSDLQSSEPAVVCHMIFGPPGILVRPDQNPQNAAR